MYAKSIWNDMQIMTSEPFCKRLYEKSIDNHLKILEEIEKIIPKIDLKIIKNRPNTNKKSSFLGVPPPPPGEPRSAQMGSGTTAGDPKCPKPTFVAHPPGPLSGTIFGQKSKKCMKSGAGWAFWDGIEGWSEKSPKNGVILGGRTCNPTAPAQSKQRFRVWEKEGKMHPKWPPKWLIFGTSLSIFGSFCEKSAQKWGSRNEPQKWCEKIHAG